MTDREKLIELMRKGYYEIPDYEPVWENLADYLLKNGVIVPKFNIGDTVYYVTGKRIKTAVVDEIAINSKGVRDVFVLTDNDGFFGNRAEIFYTSKEEAEKALAERKNK